MKAATSNIENVDDYIAGFPKETQLLLQKLRAAIKIGAPDAEEMISYQMPAYKFHGMLVYFGGYKNHIGFYPTGSGIDIFKEEIKDFKFSKGTIQFPLDKPLPLELVTKIVVFRVMQDLEKAAKKAKK